MAHVRGGDVFVWRRHGGALELRCGAAAATSFFSGGCVRAVLDQIQSDLVPVCVCIWAEGDKGHRRMASPWPSASVVGNVAVAVVGVCLGQRGLYLTMWMVRAAGWLGLGLAAS